MSYDQKTTMGFADELRDLSALIDKAVGVCDGCEAMAMTLCYARGFGTGNGGFTEEQAAKWLGYVAMLTAELAIVRGICEGVICCPDFDDRGRPIVCYQPTAGNQPNLAQMAGLRG